MGFKKFTHFPSNLPQKLFTLFFIKLIMSFTEVKCIWIWSNIFISNKMKNKIQKRRPWNYIFCVEKLLPAWNTYICFLCKSFVPLTTFIAYSIHFSFIKDVGCKNCYPHKTFLVNQGWQNSQLHWVTDLNYFCIQHLRKINLHQNSYFTNFFCKWNN